VKFLLALLGAALVLGAASGAILEWDRNPETNVLGYRVYTGTNSRNYTSVLDVSNAVTCNLTNLQLSAGTNYFAVTAYDQEMLESDFSDEVFWVKKPKPSRPTGLRIPDVVATLESAPAAIGPWAEEAQFARLQIPTSGMRFYRSRLSIGSDSNVVLVAAAPAPAAIRPAAFDAFKSGKLK
jgi:hypothetical protein